MFIIGQRLNFAGSPSLRESVQANQVDLIHQEAMAQEQSGAHALDLHVSDVQQDRSRLMADLVDQVRSVSRLPLSIDDSDLRIVETGLKRAGKNSLINSPIDVDQNPDLICSLALEFKEAQLLIVPLRQNQAPDDRHVFFETSTSILNLLEERGISRKRVTIDAILFSLKQARRNVLNTLDRIKMLKEEIGVRSMIGLSNISYQLKKKEAIHASFLTLAKKAGLDAVICDPLEKTVMKVAAQDHNDSIQREDFLKFAETMIY